jgi:hypothetical protein
MVDTVDLYVSTIDSVLDKPNSFFVQPKRLPLLFTFKDASFNSCLIEYTSIDYLTAINFAYIMRILKTDAVVKIVIYQPITVMQEYDCKQVEANAKLAGFQDFETGNESIKNPKNGKPFSTLSLSFVRPAKVVKNMEVEVNSPSQNKNAKTNKSTSQQKNLNNATLQNGRADLSKRSISSNVKLEDRNNKSKK